MKLQRHGVFAKGSFGQCFLIAPPVAHAIVEAVGPRPDETVVEIGTGTGTLARMIAPHSRRVLAIERDRDPVAALHTEGLPFNVALLEQDAAVFDYESLARSEPVPEQANAARMNFCRDKYYGSVLSGLKSGRGDFNFFSGIYDWRLEDVNRFRGHTFVNQDKLVVIVLAREGNTHLF